MKQSYHTDIAIQYKLGILDAGFASNIPSSTLHNWKRKDFSSFVGSEYVSDFDQNLQMIKDFLSKKALLKAAKAVYLVYCSYVKLFDVVKNKKKIFHQSKEVIIQTIDLIKDTVGFERALRAFGLSCQQFYAWKRTIKCPVSQINLCRKLYYNQLTLKEINVIKSYLANPEFLYWNITPIYYRILRDKAAFFSKTTFYKYVHLLKLTRSKPEKKKYGQGIRANAPRQILHADVTIYRTKDNVRLYIYLLVDNFSRYILNWKVSTTYSAKITFENIREAYEKYNLENVKPFVELITDGGSENKAEVDDFVNRDDINMRKTIAQTDIIFSNSMVEAVNKRIKYDYLFHQNPSVYVQVEPYLRISVPDYNQKPHSSLFGITPAEAFGGMLPDKNLFRPAIKASVLKRKIVNINPENCKKCF